MPYKNKIVGIYKIVNTINNKSYVGSAVNMKHRFATHKHLLNNNKHYNKHLQSSWNKYGGDKFKFVMIIETTKEKLREQEEYHILNLKSNNREFGYNKRINCHTNLGIKVSDETREKQRIAHLGHKQSKETIEKKARSRFKGVYQLDMDLNIVNEFTSIKEAAEVTGLCSRSISMCTTKKMHAHPRGEFHWCFEVEYPTFEKPKYKKTWTKQK